MSIKDFKVLAKLGQGAYSGVYKVERLSDQEIYALKKVKLSNLSDKEIQNSVNEVRILASIHSPSIISYKQSFLQGKNLCIIMQFADGSDLYCKITEHKKKKRYFNEQEIWKVLIQITKGLKTLHDLKIFHRDLKSANIFMTKKGQAKLGDMNVSKVSKNGLLYTQTGTPYYASPQVWNDKPYDIKSDIWSFGCVIYEMCTLQPPFKAEDMEGLYGAVTEGKFSPIPAFYSRELSGIIKLMLQQNPSKRPSTQKMLKSSLFKNKSKQLSIPVEDDTNALLLKTIRIPKKITYLTDRLPKPNYDFSKSSQGLLDNKKLLTETNVRDVRDRTSTIQLNAGTLPRLEGIHQEGKNSREKLRKYKRQKTIQNNSLQIEGISKEIRISLQKKRKNREQIVKKHYPKREKSSLNTESKVLPSIIKK